MDKPAGMTSFSVVHRIRKLIGIRKVGHAGTLDPAATGLLILLTGKATRSQSEFMGLEKEYLATILLGVETTTWDLDGQVTVEKQVPQISKAEITNLLADRFTGEFEQVPPAFSAIKQEGVPSYRRARSGVQVSLKPRKVAVYGIEIEDWSHPEVTIRLRCSSGFYVRSLAHDIGKAFNCGGTLKRLIRTAVGPYKLDDAFGLDELTDKLDLCRN